jgi:hypothetical protein
VLALTWTTVEHLSVLIAAVLAFPTVVGAALAAWFARQAIREARVAEQQRTIAQLIGAVSRMRRLLRESRLEEADEQANIIVSLQASLPEVLPVTGLLATFDPLTGDPRVLIGVADESLVELRAVLMITNRDMNTSDVESVARFRRMSRYIKRWVAREL